MKKLAKYLVVALALMIINCQLSMVNGQYRPSAENMRARTEFQDKKLGVFLHWGVYAMMGQGEWVMNNRNINYLEYA